MLILLHVCEINQFISLDPLTNCIDETICRAFQFAHARGPCQTRMLNQARMRELYINAICAQQCYTGGWWHSPRWLVTLDRLWPIHSWAFVGIIWLAMVQLVGHIVGVVWSFWFLSGWCSWLGVPLGLSSCYLFGAVDWICRCSYLVVICLVQLIGYVVAVIWLLFGWCSWLNTSLQLSGCYLVGAVDWISLQLSGCYLVGAVDWIRRCSYLVVIWLVQFDWMYRWSYLA